jgi:phage FluMu protein Com
METLQLQCGQCRKLIGIRVEHLGMQVQCPHCKSVVQTPPRTPETTLPPAAPPPSPMPNMNLDQTESIFAGAEESDSVIDDSQAPRVELPPPAAHADATVAHEPALSTTATAPEPATDFSQFKRKPSFDKSVVPLLMLIFLVPYALTTTAFIAYLLFAQAKPMHPLDYLRDPAPGKDKGGARPAQWGPAHDQALADHQRTTLGTSIKAGDLLVTPQRVVLTPDGDLKLILRARNVSTNTKFEPINGSFLRPKGGIQPYAYLESRTRSLDKINAADLAYHSDPKATDEPRGDALLGPGQEVTIALTTDLKFREKHVPNMAKPGDDNYTWRVQVRRGFVKVDGKDVSATTVIGVDFANSEIGRGKS